MDASPPRFYFLASILIAFCAGPSARAQEETAETPAVDLPIFEAAATGDLKAKEGQKVTIYGATIDSGKSQSGTNFVNFKDAEFYLIAFKSDLEPFKEGEPADLFDGKRIVVTGVISIYKDKPQIKLTSPDQVRLLEDGEIFPPEKPKETGDTSEVKSETVVIASGEAPENAELEKPQEKPPIDWRKFFK
jgi:hypothetical protein